MDDIYMSIILRRSLLTFSTIQDIEESKKRTKERCMKFKEELMMNRWHPTRVEKWILAGFDIEDM